MKRLIKSFLGQLGVEIRLLRNSAKPVVAEAPDASGNIITTTVRDQEIFFFVADKFDLIQKEHLHGRFYETEELQIIADSFKGGVFIDIGANVGNHTIYVAKFLGAKRIIAFEPNPAVIPILKRNLTLNDLEKIVVHHATGLSNKAGRATVTIPQSHNLGSARLVPNDKDGTLELARGDDMLRGEPVDFIKLDTEGTEMQILAGLAETIKQHRPAMFVEINHQNIPAFIIFTEENNYRVAASYIRYPGSANFLIVPR